MQSANVGFIAAALLELAKIECKLAELRRAASGDAQLVPEEIQYNKLTLNALREEFQTIGFQGVCDSLEAAAINLDHDPSLARHLSDLNHVSRQIVKALERNIFLYVFPDRHNVLGDLDVIWGHRVLEAFPSVELDAKDACHCLAVEANTAAVFHLMRVAESGLRALARDRRVKLPKDKLLEFATWEEIIAALEKAEDAIRQYKQTAAREAQLGFYHGALMQFRAFKNVWRNRTMHSREHYDRDQATSAFNHVRAFMRILASKISETDEPLPEIWTDAQVSKP